MGDGKTPTVNQQIKQAVGQLGERLAAEHLEGLGFTVLDRNWRCDRGEIDIVARRAELLVFCEVKTRRSTRYGGPLEAVTPTKARRLRWLAARWSGEHGEHATEFRIDVIGVLLQRGRDPHVTHIEAAA